RGSGQGNVHARSLAEAAPQALDVGGVQVVQRRRLAAVDLRAGVPPDAVDPQPLQRRPGDVVAQPGAVEAEVSGVGAGVGARRAAGRSSHCHTSVTSTGAVRSRITVEATSACRSPTSTKLQSRTAGDRSRGTTMLTGWKSRWRMLGESEAAGRLSHNQSSPA